MITDNVSVTEPAMFIRINGLFREDMSPEELYNATRSSWRVSPSRANKVQYALSVYQGIVREVYRVDGWFPVTSGEKEILQNRHEFVGSIAENNIRDKYLHESVKHYFKNGAQAPCIYINVDA